MIKALENANKGTTESDEAFDPEVFIEMCRDQNEHP